MRCHLVRYCWAISCPPSYLLWAFAVLGALAVWGAFRGHEDPEALLVVTLFLQTFAVSTGFTRAALRGQYDPVLIRGFSRPRLAVAHWSASAAPGVIAWTVVGILLWVSLGADEIFSLRGWLALVVASTIPWAVTLSLPPLSGGLLNAVTLVTLGTNRWGVDLLRIALVDRGISLDVWDRMSCAALFALCPFLYLGPDSQLAATDMGVQLADAVLALMAFAAATLCIVRQDYPLRSSS